MKSRRRSRAVAGAVLGLGLTLGAVACSPAGIGINAGDGGGLVDGAGMTRIEAERLSLSEQFELVGERDARMHELLAEAQSQISDEPWSWVFYGVIPRMGFNVWAASGMNHENSYFLEVAAATYPEGARGAAADLAPMIEYFESKEWPYEVTNEHEFRNSIRADTGEGFIVEWRVQPNGQYNMILTSKSYWGDAKRLLREIAERIPKGALDIGDAVPGVRPPFPSWADPAIHAPKLLAG